MVEILIGLIIAIIAIYILVNNIKNKFKGKNCCSCSSCTMNHSCASKQNHKN
ncbi:positive regulator of sigma E activity [Clostridium algifaecis]|uniref:Positive regulator of sigma E activity n=1 Tax=Clostridium algifaecis TaxID=1472040 RepID=A0ABS4KQL9_9CLOT|nr:FeoB-associated Cys-rich membrane protein [Clostridium algifaecis]MBP2031766.1 positive regulator of sigma E activity [Clostridium algifaecis]